MIVEKGDKNEKVSPPQPLQKWRDGADAIVEKANERWTQRNAQVSRKRAAEKMAYDDKRKDEDNRSEARKKGQRTIDQYFR